jgi:hypothetical protein
MDLYDGKCRIDLSEVKKIKTAVCPDEFYVSFKRGTNPKGCEGGTLSLYEEHNDFVTYKVTHTAEIVEIKL